MEMAHVTFLVALLLVTSLGLTNLPAQDNGCTRRTVPVGVVDREWNLMQGLSAANFRGKLRGQEVKILSAAIDTSPRHIALLLDASGSMMDRGGGWETAKSLSVDLVRFAPPRASIAQMAFSETVLDTAGFSQDQSALLKRLAALVKVCEEPRRGRKAALYDAIATAPGKLEALEFGDVIYAVTAARDTASQIRPERVEEELLTAGVRLYAVVTTPVLWSRARSPEEIEASKRFLSMVEATGGNALTLPYAATSQPYYDIKAKTRADALDLAFHRLYKQMGEFYRLDLSFPETVEKPTKWKLEVIDANGRPFRGVEVHYPQQLMPCAKASP